MMGVANLALALHPDTAEVILTRGERGVEIRILQCAPTNPGLVSLVGARNAEQLDAIKQEIDKCSRCLAADRGCGRAGEISITVRPRADIACRSPARLITDKRRSDDALPAQPHNGGKPHRVRAGGRSVSTTR